jgi:hypothetical protein
MGADVHRSRKRACDGKQKHKTKEEAQAHLSSLKRKRGAAIWRMDVYKCPYCKMFHVGHRF